MFVGSLIRSARQDTVRAGIVALIETYYHEYTDATVVEGSFLTKLGSLLEDVPDAMNADDELAELVTEAEANLNVVGGIRGSDETLHRVGPTFLPDDEG